MNPGIPIPTHRRRGVVAAFVVSLVMILAASPATASQATRAQDEDAPLEDPLVVLTSVSPKKASGKEKSHQWELKMVGKAPRLPVGTEIEFMVRMGFRKLGAIRMTLDASKAFNRSFPVPFVTGYVSNVSLKAFVRFERQSQEVQEAMQKRPDDFPMDDQPWFVNFMNDSFDFGTKSELQKQRAEIRAFFLDNLKQLIKIRKELSTGLSKAKAQEDFKKGESLDTEKWRSWIKKKVRDPLRKIQKDISSSKDATPYLLFTRDLDYLTELSAAIAKISVLDSRALYKQFALSADSEDISPKDLNINFRRRNPKNSDLKLIMDRLCDSQKIDPEELK